MRAGRPTSARCRRVLIGLGIGSLLGLAAVGATARSAAATPSAVPPGTPNLALIAIPPADVQGARVLHQGYFKDADLVAGYDREFKAGAAIGHSRALSLENELDVLEDATDAHGLYVTVRSVFGSSGGRAQLTKSILAQFNKDVTGKGASKVTYGKIRSLGVGNETFVQPITITLLKVIRFSFVISMTRSDRMLSVMYVMGQPNGKVAIEDVAKLQRLVSGRIVTALTPVNTALPTITGTPTEGQILTGADGTWTNTPSGFTRRGRSATRPEPTASRSPVQRHRPIRSPRRMSARPSASRSQPRARPGRRPPRQSRRRRRSSPPQFLRPLRSL